MVAVLRTFDVAHVWYGGGSLQQYPSIDASFSTSSTSSTFSTFASHVAALAQVPGIKLSNDSRY